MARKFFMPDRGSATLCMGSGKHVRPTWEKESAGFIPATQTLRTNAAP